MKQSGHIASCPPVPNTVHGFFTRATSPSPYAYGADPKSGTSGSRDRMLNSMMLRGAAQKKRSQSFHTPSATTGDARTHARTYKHTAHSTRPRTPTRAHSRERLAWLQPGARPLPSSTFAAARSAPPSIIHLRHGLRAMGRALKRQRAKRQPRHAPAGSPRAGVAPFLPKNFLEDFAPAPAFGSVCRESCESMDGPMDGTTFGKFFFVSFAIGIRGPHNRYPWTSQLAWTPRPE